ncbi:MAG: DUF975 family protein [Candidatus Kaiserbacteria bacterium]|nr:MAG: DUF975 family protein [Candidatus Kaiserbacteria bacterium]
MQGFRNTEAIKTAWEIFKKKPWVLAGGLLLTTVISWLLGAFGEQMRGDPTASLFFTLVSFVVNLFIGMGMTAFFIKAHDSIESVSINDLWHPADFWKYLGAAVLYGLMAAVGFVLLIIPGVIVVLTFQFAQYFVIDKGLGPIEALKESARITKGHKWELLGLFAFILGINILGFLALVVGLLVSVPVTALSIVYAYRTLEKLAASAASA